MSITLIVVSICSVAWLARAIHNVFFHPLARYPGSLVAAIAPSWYEWYWNYHHKGCLIFELERQHRLHGEIIRVGPNELHVNDPEVFLEMTKVGSKFTKDPHFYQFISFPNTSIGYTDPAGHRIRRQVLSPAFSPARVKELAPMVQNKVDKLLERIKPVVDTPPVPVNVNAVCKALTIDIISKIALGHDFACLDHPVFRNEFVEGLHKAFDMGWTATAFPNLTKMSLALPDWLSKMVFPIPILFFKEQTLEVVQSYLNRTERSSEDRSVVIDMLVDPNSAKDGSVLSPQQVNDEVIMLLTAGNDTTSNSMIMGIYQICRHPDVYERLQRELTESFPSPQSHLGYEEVKRLPYLNAVIKETLRYGSPIPGRLPRVVPAEGFRLRDHTLPAGTILHTSAYLLNRHSQVWSNPEQFDPDRWLAPDAGSLDKYMSSFQRGTRQCLGKDLAWCELYLLFANLFRRFDVQIHNTTDKDMEWCDVVLLNFKGDNFHVMVEEKRV